MTAGVLLPMKLLLAYGVCHMLMQGYEWCLAFLGVHTCLNWQSRCCTICAIKVPYTHLVATPQSASAVYSLLATKVCCSLWPVYTTDLVCLHRPREGRY